MLCLLSPGEVLDQCVSGNLELCKQTSRAHARWISNGAGTPADAEKAARKFWGTVLVQIMVEARLPIVDIQVESEEQRVSYALIRFLRNLPMLWIISSSLSRRWVPRVAFLNL